jgi:dihydropteroate synthase
MLDEGADIIDIGGESSRPGASPVPEEEEKKRILPVINELKRIRPDCVISADTTKDSVAEAVLEAGADIINDISGLRNSQNLARIAAKYGAGIILMHMRGSPATMSQKTSYQNLFDDLISELRESMDKAVSNGIPPDNIVIDPGIGFAKNADQCLEILKNADRFHELGRPVMIGHSKKSFLGRETGGSSPEKRLPATVAGSFWLALKKIEFIRVHDAAENIQAVKLAEKIGALRKS